MADIIPFDYQGQFVRFNSDGWINATDIARQFGKEPNDWLMQRDSVKYLCALAKAIGESDFLQEYNIISELDGSTAASRAKMLRLAKRTGLVTAKAGAGGGTWLHPKLAVVFARWLDVDFAVWCDLHIDAVLRGSGDALQEYERAHKALESRKELASEQGRGLAQWRHQKEPFQQQVEYWREQLQMTLALDAAI